MGWLAEIVLWVIIIQGLFIAAHSQGLIESWKWALSPTWIFLSLFIIGYALYLIGAVLILIYALIFDEP